MSRFGLPDGYTVYRKPAQPRPAKSYSLTPGMPMMNDFLYRNGQGNPGVPAFQDAMYRKGQGNPGLPAQTLLVNPEEQSPFQRMGANWNAFVNNVRGYMSRPDMPSPQRQRELSDNVQRNLETFQQNIGLPQGSFSQQMTMTGPAPTMAQVDPYSVTPGETTFPRGLPREQMAPPLPYDPSSAAMPVGSVDYQRSVYDQARQQVLNQLTAPVQADMARFQQGMASLKPYGQQQQALPLPQAPQSEGSGMPWSPVDLARQANMQQGTPWQPVPSTVGLPALQSPGQETAAYNAEKEAARQRYVEFMNQAQANGKGYASYWNPESQSNEKYDKGDAMAAIVKNQPRHQALNKEKSVAQRAANYGRVNGLPPAAAKAGIQGMDAMAANPQYEPTDIERYGMMLPQVQTVANPALTAWAQAAGNAADPTAFAQAFPMPPSFVRQDGSQQTQAAFPRVTAPNQEEESRLDYIRRARAAGLPEEQILATANETFGDPNAPVNTEPRSISGTILGGGPVGRSIGVFGALPFLPWNERVGIPKAMYEQIQQRAASGDKKAIEWLATYNKWMNEQSLGKSARNYVEGRS